MGKQDNGHVGMKCECLLTCLGNDDEELSRIATSKRQIVKNYPVATQSSRSRVQGTFQTVINQDPLHP